MHTLRVPKKFGSKRSKRKVMKLEDLAEKISRETDIPLCGRDVERVVAALLKTPVFWHVVEHSEEPVPVVASTLRLLQEMGLVETPEDALVFTPKGRDFVAEKGICVPMNHVCQSCLGRTVVNDAFDEALGLFKSVQEKRPKPLRIFDQAFVTPETTFARIALADARGDIRGKEIVVLGDDDLVALALAITRLPKTVTILEIDERIISFQKEQARKLKIENLRIKRHDLRKPLPEDIIGKFDVFFCDPPETVAAFDAFIGRGALSLKGPGNAGYFGVTTAESSFSKWKALQESLIARGFVITDLIRRFNEYENWDYAEEMRAWEMAPIKIRPVENWYRSAMFRVELVEKTGISNDDLTDRDIYNDQESSTV